VPRWLAGGQPCHDQAAGTDGRPIGRLPREGPRPLRPDGRDLPSVSRGLGAILVREGFAWAFTRFSVDYIEQQEEARPLWEWRRSSAGEACSSAAPSADQRALSLHNYLHSIEGELPHACHAICMLECS
jgi:hypothetical protein